MSSTPRWQAEELIMSFKTVLVQIDESRWSKTRTACATQFANAHQAHLIGMTQTGISRFIRESCLPGVELGGFGANRG
jgi:hypothetical protein